MMMHALNRRTLVGGIAAFVAAAVFAVVWFASPPADAHPDHGEGKANGFDSFITDVPEDSPHYPFVKRIYEERIVHGFGDGTYRGTDPATRNDMSVYIGNTLDYTDRNVEDATSYAVEADAPYPGQTQLADIEGNQGANSDAVWPGDEGAELHEAWVECADGKIATGGGWAVQGGADDASNADAEVMIVTNMQTGDAIPGDPAGSVLPTRHLVRGKNLGDTAITVRPQVTCIDLALAE